ncbi:Hsp70 family protein [Caenimonas sedimenti]|uniref:Hsp70 family protein n=1 Tax=Caenimonas sedimenti TaxID=2596921 RepID=A0A562ZFY4_9BURK|nr:Hsp70 family protein [Caenimonas sedimenti]TWO66634.1 Hsp70 family protein [Caenimonas sedimenti]
MSARAAPALGIDFGTSNSAAGTVDARGVARLLPLEGEFTTLPTAVFFNAEDKTVHFGRDAMSLYLAGTDGRLMRSLKSLLGSALMQEHTAVGWGEQRYQDIVARFLGELAERARASVPGLGQRVVLGRPVHFVDDAPERDRKAQQGLEQAALAAGFREVAFELEPIAAAFDYERRLAQEAVALIVDVGGGTSDFSVVRLGPDRVRHADRSADILATAGVHIGGTDFDRKLNVARVMPLLGFGHVGPSGREVPNAIFLDLATWHLINFQYAPRVVSRIQALRPDYSDLQLHDRLMEVLRQRQGHRLASEVEQAKIECSMHGAAARIALEEIEAGLAASLTPQQMGAELDELLAKVVACAQECVRRAGAQIDVIYLTGGSSALRTLQERLGAQMPGVPLVQGDLFGGVAAGLAYAALNSRARAPGKG